MAVVHEGRKRGGGTERHSLRKKISEVSNDPELEDGLGSVEK